MRNTRSRRQQILQLLIEHGSVQVADLVERFGVSAVTIRADLTHFESQGLANYLQRIQDPNGDATTQVVAKVTDPATLGSSPVTPRTALNLIAAALIGLLIALGTLGLLGSASAGAARRAREQQRTAAPTSA